MGVRISINSSAIEALKDSCRAKISKQIIAPIVRDAKRYVPIDTGALKRTISSKQTGSGTWVIYAGDTAVDYAAFVELGHEIAYRSTGGRVVHTGRFVPAQPFLRTALYQKRKVS